jgi:plasmid stabilization system protein ParE
VAEVKWLLATLDDLDEIAAYIQRDSDKYARIVVEKFRAATRRGGSQES